MQNEDPIELLKQLKTVNTPDFLLTRINAKITDITEDKLDWKWAISGLGVIALIVSLNISYLTKTDSSETNLADSFGISYSNQLYND